MTKTYTVESSCINVTGGRYKSKNPMSAGRKAASRLFKKAEKSPKYRSLKKITFCIREATQGSDKKTFDYEATRVRLAKPLVRVIDGVEIVNKFKTVVKAVAHKPIKPCKKPTKPTKSAKTVKPKKSVSKKSKKSMKGGNCGCDA